MSFADFKSANMAQTWGAITTAPGASCVDCHSGAGSMPISFDAGAFFQAISEHSRPMLEFFTISTTPPPEVVVQPHPFQSFATGTDPYREHPRFTVTAAALTSLATFYDATVARKAAGACEPPRLQD